VCTTLEDMRKLLHEADIDDGMRDSGGQVALAIFDCKQPIVVAIKGAAVGIGATMPCAMDIHLASDKAQVSGKGK
jgi:enoyl-CoA hydratase/carnithine racemase